MIIHVSNVFLSFFLSTSLNLKLVKLSEGHIALSKFVFKRFNLVIVSPSQASRTDAERTLQRDREEHQRAQEKHIFESGTQRDTIQSLSQKLSKAEARANSLENECHRNALTIAEKAVLLETLAREKDQAQAKLRELEATVLSEREQASRAGAKLEAMQERLAQTQSEGALLRQQLEEALNKGSAKDKAVTDVHQNFAEMLNQLRADGEERVHLVEERSNELAKTNGELREQNYKLEQEKAEREVERCFSLYFCLQIHFFMKSDRKN